MKFAYKSGKHLVNREVASFSEGGMLKIPRHGDRKSILILVQSPMKFPSMSSFSEQ